MAEEWISMHQDTFAKEQGVVFAVTRKSDASLVGAISLKSIKKGHQVDRKNVLESGILHRGSANHVAICVHRTRFASGLSVLFYQESVIRPSYAETCHNTRRKAQTTR